MIRVLFRVRDIWSGEFINIQSETETTTSPQVGLPEFEVGGLGFSYKSLKERNRIVKYYR